MVGNWGHVRFRCTAYTLAIQTASLFIGGHDLLIWPISVIHDHSRALFGSNKIRDLSKRLNFAPVMRNFVGMFLLYICTVLALRPERLGLHNLSQAMMVMGISEPQEEQKFVKMLGEPLEWSHWKTWTNWTVWTFGGTTVPAMWKKRWLHLWFHAFVLGWHAGNRLTELSCAEQAPKRRPIVPFRNWHRQGKPMVDMSAGKCSGAGVSTQNLLFDLDGGWRMICHKKTGLEHVGTLTEFLVEPFAHLGITLKISKKVMPKHHQCHVVCWPMTRRKRGRRRIPSSWRNVVMHFRTKRSASSRPYMAIASGARGYADQAKSEAHWHGIVRSTFHVAVGCSVLKERIRPIDSPRNG